MSKEQAMRFMLLTEADEDLKREYRGIVNRYEVKNLTEQEQEKIILEEVIPLAKSKGYDFSLGDFQELLQPAKKQLTDEELDEAVGGRGQFSSQKKSSAYVRARFLSVISDMCSIHWIIYN